MQTKLAMSTSHHPQTDGQTEKANRTLEEMARHYVNYAQNNWDELLPGIEHAYHYGVNLGPVELIAGLQISGGAALISVVFVSSLMGMNSVRKYFLPSRRAALVRRCDEWFGNFGRTDLALRRTTAFYLGGLIYWPGRNGRSAGAALTDRVKSVRADTYLPRRFRSTPALIWRLQSAPLQHYSDPSHQFGAGTDFMAPKHGRCRATGLN
jgi:hypothetical protein